ncbi:MAG TPA: pantoate--beta-alanine ligase [Bryobacteraceae bacterium]
MNVVSTIRDVRQHVRDWRRQGLTVGMVPTMGSLHEGHLALVDRSRARCGRTLATIFVNPTQFGPSEDFNAYPRVFDRDVKLLNERGCDLVFAPSVEELFPDGYQTLEQFRTRVNVHELCDGLCGALRPGHFSAIATQVMKLFMIGQPDFAFFGEKDYQQLQVVRRMVRDLSVPVEIESIPIVRAPDGLALSSRNAYLTPEERKIAPLLSRVLCSAVRELQDGGKLPIVTERARENLIGGGFSSVDYVTLVDDLLQPLEVADKPARLLAAAWLGRARLIDNAPFPP